MKLRKWVSTLLAVCMLLPTVVTAVDVETEPEIVQQSMVCIENPMGAMMPESPVVISEISTEPDSSEVYSTVADAADVLLTGIKARESEIQINVSVELFEELGGETDAAAVYALYDAAFAHNTDDPTGGDYAKFTMDQMPAGWGQVKLGDEILYYIIGYYPVYRTTLEQENAVDAQVDALVTEWKAQDLDEYQTIQTIYDYITANVCYDHEGLNDAEDMTKYTAYGALCENSAVCMGIAILFYRLALEMGIDARFINSIDEENHAWNIVKLGNYYYNLDATWDLDEKHLDGDHWFLLNMAGFQVNYDGSPCHTRTEALLTDAFMKAYPMAEVSYGVITYPDVPETEWDELTWQFDSTTGTLTVSGQGVIPGNYDEETGATLAYPWQAYVEGIRHVVIGEGITEILYGMLKGLQMLETLSLPSTLVNFAVQELSYLRNLETITIDANNPKYFMQDGALISNENGYCTLESYLRGNTAMSYSVPGTIDCINTYAFSNHEYLEEVYIPASVTKIWEGAFRFSFALTAITVAADNPNYISVDDILYTKDQKELLVYPYSYGAKTFTVPNTVTKLTFDVFQTEYMEKLIISSNVETIGEPTHAISDYALREIEVVEDNTNYCSVDGVLYSKDMTTLYWCPIQKADTVYHIPDTVTMINTFSLLYANHTQTLYMGAAVETIDSMLLADGTAVTSVYFPGDLPTYFEKAFSNMADKITFYYPTGASGWTTPTTTVNGITYNTVPYTPTEEIPWNTWNNIRWKYDETTATLTIGGEGEVPSEGWYENYPWGEASNLAKKIVFEEGITKLGTNCIFGIEMPFTEVQLPSTLQEIVREGTMLKSTKLETITVADGGPYYVEDNVLFKKEDDKIILVCYPGGQTRTTYAVPDGVTHIGNYAFCCTKTTLAITFPESLVSIGSFSFDELSGVHTFHIPKNVSEIDVNAFTYCTVERFTVDPENQYFTTIDGVLFTKDKKTLHTYTVANGQTTYTVPDGVEMLPENLYRWSPNLQKLYLPDTVQGFFWTRAALGNSVLEGIYVNDTNPYLTDIDGILYDKDVKTLVAYPGGHAADTYIMPDTVEKIGQNAIYFVRNLKTIHLSSSLQQIADFSLQWGNDVTAVYFPGDLPTWLGDCCGRISTQATFYYPTGASGWTTPTTTVNGITYNTVPYTPTEEIPWNTWNNIRWKYDETTATLTIGGEGEIPGYNSNDPYPWETIIRNVTTLVIEEGITEIPYGVLSSFDIMQTLALPSSLTNLGMTGWYAYNLQSINVTPGGKYESENGVLFVNENGERSLMVYPRAKTGTYYAIPDDVQNILYEAFFNNRYLRELNISKSVEQIDNGAIKFCDKLVAIAVDTENEHYKSVDGVLYSKDMTLLHTYPDGKPETTFTVPDTVTEMTYTMFMTSNNLKVLYIPASVETIWEINAYSGGCTIENIHVAADNPSYCSINGVLYNKDVTKLIKYPIGKMDTVYIMPDTVTTTGWYALWCIRHMTTLYIGENLKDTDKDILEYSFNITSVYFPGDLPTYFEKAFSNMADKITFYYPTGASGWTTPTTTVNGITYNTVPYTPTEEIPWNTWNNIRWKYDETTATLTIGGEGEIPGYNSNDPYPWETIIRNVTTLVIEEGITVVPNRAFTGVYNLTTLSIPASMQYIQTGNPSLFVSARSLSTITAAAGGTYYVQDGVLYTADTLVFYPANKTDTTYTIPAGIKTIGAYAFQFAQNLTALTLPESLKTIGESALSLNKLQSLHIPKNVSSIHKNAFPSMSTLTAFTVDNDNATYTTVDGILYTKDMTKLVAYPDNHPATTFTVPDTVVEMTSSMLHTSHNLKILNLPASVTTIWINRSVSGGVVLEAINVDANNPSYCAVDGVLYSKDMTILYKYPNDKADKVFHIPDSVVRVDSCAMFSMTYLQTLYFGSGVTNVGSSQFMCPQLTSIYLPGDLPSWFNNIFGNLRYYNLLDKITFYYPTGASGWTTPTTTVNGITYNTVPYTPKTTTAEDLTGDGAIDTDDVALLIDYFSGKSDITFDPTKADFNHDGTFTRADAMYLARALAGWNGYTLN